MSLNYKRIQRKRKSDDSFDSLDGFLVNDTENLDDLYIPKKRKNSSKFYEEKENQTRKISEEKEVTIDDIFDLDLGEDDNVWFYDHINIRDASCDEEHRLNMTYKIFNRYNLLKKLKNEGIDNAYKSTEDDVMNRIMESSHSTEYKSKLINIIKDKISNTGSEEYYKALELVNIVLDIPTCVKNVNPNVTDVINKLATYLDDNMYGMENVKLKILESMCSILCSKNNSGKILTLVGPPGVGKTAICSVISKAMNMPFSTISLGLISDPSDLCGHSSTYIAARPGRFLNILRQARQLDNLILLDEIDKLNSKGICESNISSVLIHVLDPCQNDKIRDAYCQDFPFDMSKTFFVLSCNDITTIDKVLMDRLEIVHVSGYDINEKTEIVCRHLIPALIEKYRIKNQDIIINKPDIAELIKSYEAYMNIEGKSGVRLINKLIETIFCKLILSKNISKKSKYHKMLKVHNLKTPLALNKSLLSIL
jgi:ATP-dependent Lon protease